LLPTESQVGVAEAFLTAKRRQIAWLMAALASVHACGVDDTALDGFDISTAGNESGFVVAARDCGTTLRSGEECQLTLTFTPQGAGMAAGVAILTALDTPEVRVPLQGTGAIPGTLISTTSQLSFGEVEVGFATAPLEWPITNNGTMPTGPLTLTNTDPASFEATTDCGPPLAPGASCTVSVRFLAPVRSAPYEAGAGLASAPSFCAFPPPLAASQEIRRRSRKPKLAAITTTYWTSEQMQFTLTK
jgi:hypothetical protein